MSLEAEREMWAAVASQPAPAAELAWRDGSQGRECVSNAARRRPVVCDRCGRELAGGLPSPCARCATYEEQAREAELADDVMPCGCSSGSCYCDGEEVSATG